MSVVDADMVSRRVALCIWRYYLFLMETVPADGDEAADAAGSATARSPPSSGQRAVFILQGLAPPRDGGPVDPNTLWLGSNMGLVFDAVETVDVDTTFALFCRNHGGEEALKCTTFRFERCGEEGCCVHPARPDFRDTEPSPPVRHASTGGPTRGTSNDVGSASIPENATLVMYSEEVESGRPYSMHMIWDEADGTFVAYRVSAVPLKPPPRILVLPHPPDKLSWDMTKEDFQNIPGAVDVSLPAGEQLRPGAPFDLRPIDVAD